MKIIITETQYNLLVKQNINEDFLNWYGEDDFINEQHTPEEWEEEIRALEREIGNPSGWTMNDYFKMQQKLNDYKKWRETTPEGMAVIDLSNKPNEYVVPLPKHLKPVMESRLVKIIKKVINENNGNRYETISHWIDMLEKCLENYDSIDCKNITKEYEQFYCDNLGDYPMERIMQVLEKLKKEQIELLYNQFDDSFGN